MDKYVGYVLMSKSLARCIATATMFASIAVIFSTNPIAFSYFLENGIAGLIFMGFITGLTTILWAKDPIQTIVKYVGNDEDKEEEVEEEEDSDDEEDCDDCAKCGNGLEIYDPKPLCAECKAECEYYASKSGVRKGGIHVEE